MVELDLSASSRSVALPRARPVKRRYHACSQFSQESPFQGPVGPVWPNGQLIVAKSRSHLFQPIDDLTVELFLDGDMGAGPEQRVDACR
jgi:hypothetical protein